MEFINNWQSKFPEHPSKMASFKNKLDKIDWNNADKKGEFQKLFSAIDDLADAELRYYFRRRKTRATISIITRICGWAFGGIGILLPLIASTDPSRKDLTAWGFVFIAAAASSIAANNLFGGTTGHVNFVQTQLSIESLMIQNRIEWTRFISGVRSSEMSEYAMKTAFDVIKKYAEDYAKITAAETLAWRNDVLDAMTKFAASIKQKPI